MVLLVIASVVSYLNHGSMCKFGYFISFFWFIFIYNFIYKISNSNLNIINILSIATISLIVAPVSLKFSLPMSSIICQSVAGFLFMIILV